MSNLETNFLTDHGYLLYENFFDHDTIEPVNQLLNTALQKSGIPDSPETAKSWVREKSKLQRSKILLDLINQGKLNRTLNNFFEEIQPQNSCQVAFRFPGEKVDNVDYWHIDNYTERDFERKSGIPRDFTALVGVYIADNLEDNSGNFTVLPGSHHRIQAWSRNHGGYEYYERNGLTAMKQKFQENELQTKPFQVKAPKGSIIITHRMLLHTMGPNMSENIRKVVWFRVSKKSSVRGNQKNLDPETFTNIWKEWKPVNIRQVPCKDFRIAEQIKKIEEFGYGYQVDSTEDTVLLRIRPSIRLHGEPCMFASMVSVKYSDNSIEVHTNGFISRKEHSHMASDIMEQCEEKSLDLLKVAIYIQQLDFEQMIYNWYPLNESKDNLEKTCKIMKFQKIMSRSKCGMMERWAKELELKGGILLGRPGFCFVIGPTHHVNIFMKRFECFHWKKVETINTIKIEEEKVENTFFICSKENVRSEYLKELFLTS